ncbi:sulfite exporter TauE/SafE family protein [Pontibacillus salicampi]|uniref:Sulfite exporter TauE/SafE family protein n=1 Tax=Pontibacillus salicampi TaxID=1449801 RepID=A0ABV6LSS4_9BACI
MYGTFSRLASWFSDPLLHLANGYNHIPLLAALFLGLVGAVAPCQITGNIGALSLYGNQSLQTKTSWCHIGLFIAGKMVVFSVLGALVWVFGQEIRGQLTLFLPIIRKLIGPTLVLAGLYLIGVIKIRKTLRLGSIFESFQNKPAIGSFFMGISFSLAFCPTMFILFFVTLMPLVLSTSYGIVLPGIFAVGTSLPVLIILFLIWYFDMSGILLKRSRMIGKVVQIITGFLLIVIGILDTLTYWL